MSLRSCKRTGCGFQSSVIRVGSLSPDRQTDRHPRHKPDLPARKNTITQTPFKRGGKKINCSIRIWYKTFSIWKNTCLQGRTKLSIGVISYSHGNNSWLGIFCKLSALWLCLVGGEAALGGSGGNFCNEHLFLHQPAAKEDLQRMAKKIFD